jgi:hypothetical protein
MIRHLCVLAIAVCLLSGIVGCTSEQSAATPQQSQDYVNKAMQGQGPGSPGGDATSGAGAPTAAPGAPGSAGQAPGAYQGYMKGYPTGSNAPGAPGAPPGNPGQ